MSQIDIADKLGTTQAAISQYLSQKRGNQLVENLLTLPEVKSAVHSVVEKITDDESAPSESMSVICTLCETLRQNRITCTLHQNTIELPDDCRICLR
jgi:predicted transcriptional regulator